MSIDRAAALRQAEKLLRQGKLDQAIAEYLRLVEDQPRDWNTANVLGDLYVRAGHLEQAVEQFARSAESLCHEGFLPKASALYKKILKLQPDSDRALMRAGELAAQQGLLADARAFFSTAAHGRRHHGDTRGSLEITVRLGALDPADVQARFASARARTELGDTPGALHEYESVATWLVEQGRDDEAVAALRAVLDLDPGNTAAARELARILVAAGRFDEATPYLTADTIGTDLALTRLSAQLRLEQGDLPAGLELIDRLLIGDDEAPAVVAEMIESLAASRPESAWALTERLVGASVERADWSGAAEALRRFNTRVPRHVPALMRLLDVCVDGGLTDDVVQPQAQLADAYLAAGAAGEAKYVAEDLVTRQPWERAHYARMRAALASEGHADPDRALADWLAETPAFGLADEDEAAPPEPLPTAQPSTPDVSLGSAPGQGDFDPSAQWLTPTVAAFAPPPPPAPPAAQGGRPEPSRTPQDEPAPVVPSPDARRNPHAIDLDLVPGTPTRPASGPVEEDLSVVLDGIKPAAQVPVPRSPAPAAVPAPPAAPADIESVFAVMRDEALQRPLDEASDVAFTRGAAMAEAGDLEQCIEPLRMAARSPRRRFAAATLLAQVYERQQRRYEAIEWLGHAVDAPGLSAVDRSDTLLRMADLLEQAGEPASALAVCLELQAEAGDYKDVAVRIARLSRAQAGG